MQKIGSNGLERSTDWVHNDKIRSNGLERSQLWYTMIKLGHMLA